jgi:hypothetical protein
MDRTGLEPFQMASFGITGVEPSVRLSGISRFVHLWLI